MARPSRLLLAAVMASLMAASALAAGVNKTGFTIPGEAMVGQLHEQLNGMVDALGAPLVPALDAAEKSHANSTRAAAQAGVLAAVNAAAQGDVIADAVMAHAVNASAATVALGNQAMAALEPMVMQRHNHSSQIANMIVPPMIKQGEVLAIMAIDAVAANAKSLAKSAHGAAGSLNKQAAQLVGLNLTTLGSMGPAELHGVAQPLMEAGTAVVVDGLKPVAKLAVNFTGAAQLAADAVSRPIRTHVHGAVGSAVNTGVGALKAGVLAADGLATSVSKSAAGAGLQLGNAVRAVTGSQLAKGLHNMTAGVHDAALNAAIAGGVQLAGFANKTHHSAENYRQLANMHLDVALATAAEMAKPYREQAVQSMVAGADGLADGFNTRAKEAMPGVNANIAAATKAFNDASDSVFSGLELRAERMSKARLPKPVTGAMEIADRSVDNGVATLQEALNGLVAVHNRVSDNVNKQVLTYQEKIEAPRSALIARAITAALKADAAVTDVVAKSALSVSKSIGRGVQYAVKKGIEVHNEASPREIHGHAIPVVEVQADRIPALNTPL